MRRGLDIFRGMEVLQRLIDGLRTGFGAWIAGLEVRSGEFLHGMKGDMNHTKGVQEF